MNTFYLTSFIIFFILLGYFLPKYLYNKNLINKNGFFKKYMIGVISINTGIVIFDFLSIVILYVFDNLLSDGSGKIASIYDKSFFSYIQIIVMALCAGSLFAFIGLKTTNYILLKALSLLRIKLKYPSLFFEDNQIKVNLENSYSYHEILNFEEQKKKKAFVVFEKFAKFVFKISNKEIIPKKTISF